MGQLTEPSNPYLPYDWSEPLVVHQASGMIAARDGVTCAKALSYLRRYAATHDQPLRAVCAAIVARSLSPELASA